MTVPATHALGFGLAGNIGRATIGAMGFATPADIFEMFEAGSTPRNRPTASTTAVRIDTS